MNVAWKGINYKEILLHFRGYGESDHPMGREQYKLSYLVNDVKEIVSKILVFCAAIKQLYELFEFCHSFSNKYYLEVNLH